MCDYNLATTIAIWLFTQTHMCRMGTPIFAAVIQLKFSSTTRASHLNIPLIEIKIQKNGSIDCGSDYRDYPSWFYPTDSGEPPLDQKCRNPRQRHQFLHKWCFQPVDPINLR